MRIFEPADIEGANEAARCLKRHTAGAAKAFVAHDVEWTAAKRLDVGHPPDLGDACAVAHRRQRVVVDKRPVLDQPATVREDKSVPAQPACLVVPERQADVVVIDRRLQQRRDHGDERPEIELGLDRVRQVEQQLDAVALAFCRRQRSSKLLFAASKCGSRHPPLERRLHHVGE